MGIQEPAEAVDDPIPVRTADADISPEAVFLQAHGTVPGAGGELGVVFRPDPEGSICRADRAVCTPGPCPEPVRVYGGATVAAAGAGAAVTHVDASKGMVQWAKENAASSGLSEAPIRWLVDDCRKFVEREIRRGNHYDGIIMDPPSYGRGPKGELWKIEDSLHELVQLTARLLSDRPLFYLLNSYTTGLAPAVLTYLIHTEVVSRFGGTVDSQEVGLPVTDSGLVLPCGAAGRWQA